jgi:hypothetical protein
MCVLANHIPLLTGLGTEVILIRTTPSSDWIVIFVAGGFALVRFYLCIIKFYIKKFLVHYSRFSKFLKNVKLN